MRRREGFFGRVARIYSRLWPLLRQYRFQVVVASLCAIGFTAMGVIAPWPVQIVIDGVLLDRRDTGIIPLLGGLAPESKRGLLTFACVGLVLIAVLRVFFSHGHRVLAAGVGHRAIAELRGLLFTKLQYLTLGFHSSNKTGDLVVRMTGDVSMLREILVPAVLDMATRILVVAGMLGFMLLMDPWLTLIAVLVLPVLFLGTHIYGRRIREATHQQRRREGQIASVAGESLGAIKLVQAYAREKATAERFSSKNRRSMRAGLKAVRLQESLSRLVDLALAIGSAVILWVGASRVLVGAMSPGEIVVFLTYLKGMYKPIQGLTRMIGKVNKAVACGQRVQEVLDAEPDGGDDSDACTAPAFRGEIVFDRVTFGYDPGHPVLRDVSFRVDPGETLGLVGLSGGGKSTILALLLRLYEPQQGRILIDGVDIRHYSRHSYRQQISIVLQDPFLFGISIADNIRFGAPGATDEQVEQATRSVGAHEFVARLSHGYDTVLAESGATLSRGQQQRLALARAVIRDTPIMVFDEPTTGLDARTEREIISTLSGISKDKTCLWIAHDLDQMMGCHRVLVLRDGEIVERGKPQLLLKSSSAFSYIFGDRVE